MKNYSRVYASIDLDAALHNMEAMHRLIHKDTKIFAVVKTDGYGHGAVEIAQKIEPLDYLHGFCVATAEEALILKKHGITKPVLVLSYSFPEHYADMIENDIRMAVFSYEAAKEMSDTAMKLGRECRVHIKIDTGMGRIGYQVSDDSADEIARIAQLPNIVMEGIFTHFARADETDKTAADRQYAQFKRMIAMCADRGVTFACHHCSNSAGIVDLPEFNMDIVRAGITLYGLWPSDEVHKERINLQPLMEIKSHVTYVKELPAGHEISYGGTYTTQGITRIATIPVGYGDGYPRSLSNKGYVLIHGKKAPILGRVCMDQFMVDVTDIEDVGVQTEVTLLGKDGGNEITMDELAGLSGRFNYEFACVIGKRIPRVFLAHGRVTATKDYFNE